MSERQKQCLLCFLGYYNGEIDGIWGPKSEDARNAFCQYRGCGADWEEELRKAVSESDWWATVRWFSQREFACKCGKYCDGYPARMERRAVELADGAREYFGKPGIVVSGLRCAQWNRIQGGVSNSRHQYGKAVDLRIQGVRANELLEWMLKQPGVRYAYAINGTNVHFDIV